jgi:hypothetical protein
MPTFSDSSIPYAAPEETANGQHANASKERLYFMIWIMRGFWQISKAPNMTHWRLSHFKIGHHQDAREFDASGHFHLMKWSGGVTLTKFQVLKISKWYSIVLNDDSLPLTGIPAIIRFDYSVKMNESHDVSITWVFISLRDKAMITNTPEL